MRKTASQTAPNEPPRARFSPRRLAAWSLAAAGLGFASAAEAQLPPAPTYAPAPQAGAGMAPPPQMAPVYSQDPAAIWPAQAGEAYHPYPKISPFGQFNVLSTTHENSNGTWFQRIYQKDRQFHFRSEAVWFNFEEAGKSVVGSNPLEGAVGPTQQIISDQPRSNPNLPFIGGGGGVNGGGGAGGGGLGGGAGDNDLIVGGLANIVTQLPTDFVFVGPGTFPYPFLSDDAAPTTGADLEAYVRNDVHPVRTLRDLGEANSLGLRLRWGWDNGDGSGAEFFGLYSGQASNDLTRGIDSYRGMDINAALIISQPGQFVSLANGSIPLDTGLPTFPEFGDALKVNGFSQKYDVFYSLENDITVYGGGLLAFAQTLVDAEAFRLRMFWGAEYTYIDDNFRFRGIDSGSSGFDEDLQATGGVLPGGAGGGGGGGGGDTFFTQVTSLQFAVPTLTQFSPDRFFEANLSSTVDSHLAGPTMGLRYEFGRRNSDFRLSGTTTVGLLANHERKEIFGENIGEQTAMKTIYGIDFLTDPASGTPLPSGSTAFSDEKDTTHVSPLFRQDIDGSIAVGRIVPPLRDTDFFGDCRFTFGYGLTVLGEVQRPGDGVQWRGFPDFPTVKSDRSSLLVQEGRLGLEWQY